MRGAAARARPAAAAAMSALCDPPGAASPPRPPLSAQDLAQELKAFLSGVDPAQGTPLSPPAHARCALLLLRCLPPARHAALQHLRGLFDQQVSAHLARYAPLGAAAAAGGVTPPPPPEDGGAAAGLEEAVQEVERVLAAFVRANPAAWAPPVSAWAIELMGQLSSKYGARPGLPPPASLSELLRLWGSCRATRALLDTATLCLAAMSGACPDACVDALLDASLQHSPHFDWALAHIGGSFPATIISRVLSCGLKDFCAHGEGVAAAGTVGAAGAGDKRAPKLASVVGILGHLAARHAGSIKQELLRLFHESLGPGREPQQRAAVPFLLQLALMSPPLLAAVAPELVASLTPPVLAQLHQHFAGRPREELEQLVGLLVHLVCQTSAGAFPLLRFLLATAMPPSSVIAAPGPPPPPPPLPEGVREACERVLQLLLLHLHKLVFNRPLPAAGVAAAAAEAAPRPVPFLEALRPHLAELCRETLRLERKRCRWLQQLLALLAVYAAPHGASEALGLLLTLARGQEELALATQLHALLAACLPDLLPPAVAACLCQVHAGRLPQPQTVQLCRNLALVLQAGDGDGGGGSAVAAQLGAALAPHLPELAPLLLHPEAAVAEAACQLLAVCPLPAALPPAHLFAALRAAAHHFFSLLRRRRRHGLGPAGRLLARLSGLSPAAAKAAVQQLVEGALRGGNAELFAAPEAPEAPAAAGGGGISEGPADVSLLDVNRRFATAVNFAGGVWSVFHAGVVGRGLKAPPAAGPRDPEELAHNAQTFLTLLLRCCRRPGDAADAAGSAAAAVSVHPEAAKAVAAALVEAVCPEAAGGELAWPPEEQTRGTVERDLRICRRFRAQPLLFPLLRLVAAGPPALCYCSVLLRGLLAALLAHWEASRQPTTASSPWHLRASCALVAVMAEGSLLPPLLGDVHELFEHVAPFEVHLLLLSVWEYLRENHPLPQRFAFRPHRGTGGTGGTGGGGGRFLRDFQREGDVGRHLGVLHSVLHKNIHRLGHLAARFRP